jgi:hypothetical protein
MRKMLELTLEETLKGIREFEDLYQSIYKLPIFETLKYSDLRETFFEELPQPCSFQPEYSYHGKTVSLDNAVSIPFLSLEDIITQTEIFLPVLKTQGEVAKKILKKAHLINFTIFTKLDEETYDWSTAVPKERKYESMPAFTHPWKTQLLLPKNAPNWVIVYALSHDSIEDSHRHKVLKKWLNLKQDEQLSEASKIFLLEAFPSINSISFLLPLSKKQYNNLLDEHINHFVNLLYSETFFKPNDKYRLQDGLFIITKKAYETYNQYLDRIGNIQDKYNLYWTIISKINDRIDNSHFNPKKYKNHFSENGAKILKDGIKNIHMLSVAQKSYFRLEDKLSYNATDELKRGELSGIEYLNRKNSLAALTNNNMNEFMKSIIEKYGEEEFSLKYGGVMQAKKVSEWMNIIEGRLYDYYLEGGFNLRDKETGNPKDLFNFKGSLNLLDKFFEGEIESIFGKLNKYNALLLFKYAAMAKVFSCLYLSHDPFVNGKLVINSNDKLGLDTLGAYNPSNKNYLLNSNGI